MSAHSSIRIAAVVVLLGGLTLTGCSADGAGEERSFDEYLQVLQGTAARNLEQAKADDAQREQLIAECMAEQGFDYTPMPWSDDGLAPPMTWEELDGDGPRRGSMEFAESYGYGIVESPGRADDRSEEPDIGAAESLDPNAEYVMSLSESELEAYYAALFGFGEGEGGELDEDGDPAGEDTHWSETQGCHGKAAYQVSGDQASAEFGELFAQAEALLAGPELDDEIAALKGEWAACMKEKGFAFSTREEATDFIVELAATELFAHDAGEDDSQGNVTLSPETGDEPAPARRDAFQAKEIEQAVADVSCAMQVGYDDRLQEAHLAQKRRFVADHRAQLDALFARYGTQEQD